MKTNTVTKATPAIFAVLFLFLSIVTASGHDHLSNEYQLFENIPIVTLPAGMAQKATEAPGIIKVYTKDDIAKLGYYTLRDLARITPGYAADQSFGMKGYNIRGIPSGGFDNYRTLLMIDGIPINFGRSYYSWTQEEVPLFFAEKVEFLKGPSSALYGPSAFLGVINVVPGKPKEGNSFLTEMKFSAGSPESIHRLMGTVHAKTEQVGLMMAFSEYEKEASMEKFEDNLFYTEQTDAIHNSLVMDNVKTQSFMTSLYFPDESNLLHGFEPGFIFINRRGGLVEGWSGATHHSDFVEFQVVQPYIKYSKELMDSLTLNIKGFLQQATESGEYTNIFQGEPTSPTQAIRAGYRKENQVFQADANLVYKHKDICNITIGAAYDSRGEDDYPESRLFSVTANGIEDNLGVNGSEKYKIKSAYMQTKTSLPILAGMDIIAGVRYDEATEDSQLSPRAGLVQKINENLNLKLLYGSALKVPGIKELMYMKERRDGAGIDVALPKIKAETIDTYEVSLVYAKGNLLANLTYFNNQIDNPIIRDDWFYDNENSLNIFINGSDGYSSEGVEADIEYVFSMAKIFANATYQDTRDEDDSKLENVPEYTANLGLMYTIEDITTDISAVVKHIHYTSRGADTADYIIAQKGKSTPENTVLDINIVKYIGTNTTIELQVLNVFDKEYFIPAFDGLVFDHIQPGRQILFSVGVKF